LVAKAKEAKLKDLGAGKMRNVQGTATPVFKTKTKTKTDDLKHDDDGKEHSDSLTKDKSSDVWHKAPLRKLTTLPKPA